MFKKSMKDLKERELWLKREELNIVKQHNEITHNLCKEENELKKEELRTKDRADVSLKDYELLVKERNEYKELANQYKKYFMEIAKPFMANKVPSEIIEKLFNGAFEFELHELAQSDDPLRKRYALCFSFPYSN